MGTGEQWLSPLSVAECVKSTTVLRGITQDDLNCDSRVDFNAR